jgi:hypothetical protein
VATRDESQALSLFQERYRNTPSQLARQIEQRVIGGDWGANGYTTRAQADTLARELGVSAGDRLLDLGTGRGWPGLYLAARRVRAATGRPADHAGRRPRRVAAARPPPRP